MAMESYFFDQENVPPPAVEEASQDSNNNALCLSAAKRCLFGKSDPEDTARLLQEQIDKDRRRFIARWGVDVVHMGVTKPPLVPAAEPKKKKLKMKKERVSKERRVLKPYNKQSRITGWFESFSFY